MKLRLNPTLRRCILAAFTAIVSLSTGNTAQGSILYSSVGMQTYTDFGQNCGRYQAGRVNDLLSSIRAAEGGVKIYYYGEKFEGYSYTLRHGMIDFSSGSSASVDAAIGYGFLATVQHNGVQNPSYAAAEVGSNAAVKYAGIEYRNVGKGLGEAYDQPFLYAPHTDYKITRLSKLVTDVRTSDVYNDTEMLGQALTGQFLYRAGSGTMKMAEVDENGMANAGSAAGLAGAYSYVTGGLVTIDSWGQRETQEGGDFNYSVNHTVSSDIYGYITGEQASGQVNPLPYVSLAGDSGSPSWVWNDKTGTYQYISALQSGGGTYSQDRGAWAWTLEKMESFNKRVALGEDTLIRLTAANTLGDTISGNANGTTLTVQQHLGSINYGEETIRFAGNSLNTWLSLNDIKDELNWYNYGNEMLNANGNVAVQDDSKITYGELMHTDSIILTAGSSSPYTVQLDDTVDTGIGFVQFSKAEGVENATFRLVSEAGEQNQLNSAGFVVDKGVTLDVSLTGDSSYLREWRKVGDGDLRISGNGDNDILLNVGGGSVGTNDGSDAGHASGKVYLEREGGYAAYNVLASTGSTIVLKDISQVKHDVTLGAGGATLDLNGNDYTWNNAGTEDGFTLHMLTEKDILANHGDSPVTVTITDAGDTLLGSFEDSAIGAMEVIYAGEKHLAMHSTFTKLTNEDSSFTVQSGSVSLGGTMTVHGRGSLTGTNGNRVENPNDWHYADAAMDVTVENGATFTLDSHARLTGDVTVNEGGTFVMREGTKHQMEYIEGGFFAEDTQNSFYSQFHGLKGDITLAGGELQVAYNAGTDSHNTYAGNISGNASAVTFDLGTEAALSLKGTNDFTVANSAAVQLVSGGVIAETAAAAGYANGAAAHTWNIGEKAYLAVKGMSGDALMTLVSGDSAGALALTESQTSALTVHDGLFIGALEGERVEYGAAGTDDALAVTTDAEGARHWLLGGGGGELVVNFALDNDQAALVLGNEYTTGSVTLTNENNHIGSISFGGKVTLGYTSEAALGGADINLAYSHRIIGSASSLNNITAASAGAMLLDNMVDTDVSLAEHPSLALGAAGNVTYTGTVSLGSGDTYRFGGVSGKLALAQALANNGATPTNLVVDGQTYSGGVVELKQAATLTGNVTVMGYDREQTSTTEGDITLRLSAANALASAASVTLHDGGILDVNGTRQQLNNLSMAAGSTLADSSRGSGSAVLHVGDGVTTALNGALEVATLTKTGSGTMNLGGTNSYALLNIAQGKVALTSDTALQNAGITNVQSGAVLDATAVRHGGQIALTGGELKVGAALDGVVQALSGTSVLSNSGGTSALSAEIGAAAGATLKLTDGTFQLTNGSINTDTDNGTEIVKSGTLSVTANRLEINNSATADIGGTLSFDSTASKQYLFSNRSGDNTTRNIEHLHTGNNYSKELHISEQTWNTIWNIHQLTGVGTLQWDSKSTHWYSSRIVLDGENTFSGTILAKRENSDSSVRAYASYLELAHDKAAQYAMVNLVGTDANDYMNLAVNTDNASLRSLTGNTYTTLYAGASVTGLGKGDSQTSSAGLNDHPGSTRRASLTFTGNISGTFQGNVYGGENGNGISLVMNAAYDSVTQTFNGDTVQLNDVTVEKGKLVLSSTGLTIAGNVSIATGGTLKTGSNLNLRSGQTLSVTGSGSTAAALDSVLVLNGGSLAFDGATLAEAQQYALSVQGVSNNATGLTLNFFNTSYLVDGEAYKLVSGDWSALNLGDDFFTVTGMDYLTSTLTRGTDGLSVTFSLAEHCSIWDGTPEAQTWSSTAFGQQQRTTTADDILVFNDSASCKTVVVEGAQQARTLVFDSLGNYTVDTTQGSVQTTDVDVYNEGNATLGSGVTISGEALVGKGSLTVTDTATLERAQSVHGGGTLIIDWGSESGSVANLGEIGALHLASGRLETAATLETPSVTIDKGAALDTAANQTAAINLAGAGREGIDTAALSLSGNVSLSGAVALTDDAAVSVNAGNTATFSGGVNAEEHTLTKTGAGTMDIAVGTTQRAQGITVDKGELVLHRNNAVAKNIGTLRLNDGATFTQYNDTQAPATSAVGTLVMGEGTGTVRTTHFDGSLQLGTLNLADGADKATLNLVNDSDVERYTLFSLGRSGAEVGNFAGTINLSSTHSGKYRSATLVVNRGDITKNAVINLASSVSGTASLALGLHDGTVTVAGLESGQKLGSRAYVYSGTSAANATKVTQENTVRTLAIATAAETDATFYGAVEENINIVKSGEGTQRFSGSSESFNGTLSVLDGTLALTDSRMLRQATSISVAESGTLSLDGMMLLSTPTIQNEGTVSFGSSTRYFLGDISTPATYTLVSGSGNTAGLSLANFLYDGHNLLGYSAGVRLLFSDNAVTLRISKDADRTITWNGTADSSTWDNGISANWLDADSAATEAYRLTDSVVFGAEGSKAVSIADGTSVQNMAVAAGDYSFTGMAGLTIDGALRVEEGASATFDTLPAKHTAILTADGAVTAGATTITGGTATFNGTAHFTNGLSIDGGTSVFNGVVTVDATPANNDFELTINRGDVTFNDDVTVTGKVKLGDNKNAVSGGQALANITIGKNAVFTAGDIDGAWGFNTLTVDGSLNTTHLNLSTGTTQTITGCGTINADSLTGGNNGIYNFSNLRLNIGSGGMDGNRKLSFTNMTLGALDNWTANRTIDLAGAVTIDTAKVGSESGEGTTVTLSGLNASGLTSLTKTGAGTLVMNGDNASTFRGTFQINEGTVKLGQWHALGDASVADRVIVGANGTLDVNGREGDVGTYSIIMNGGTLTNTGATVGNGKRQIVSGITLTVDSIVSNDSGSDFGMIAHEYASTSMLLQGHVLEKKGTGTYYLINTTVTGGEGGKLKVSEGTLQFNPGGNDSQAGSLAADIEMVGGTLSGMAKLGGDITVDVAEEATISAEFRTEGHTLTVNSNAVASEMSGALSGAGKLIKTGAQDLTLTNGSASFTGGAEVQQGTLRLSGNAVGMMDRLSSLSVAEDATLHLSNTATSNLSNKCWDGLGVLGFIEIGSGSADMTVNASTFSELNENATLVLNRNAQYEGNGTAAAPATLNNNLILRTDASRIALHNVDVFNGDIAIEGTAVIASLQRGVNRTTTFNGSISGDTLSVGGAESGAYQQFYVFSDSADATELSELHIGKSGNTNWTNVIVQGETALAQNVSFDNNCAADRGRLFIEADNSSTRTLQSDAGVGYAAVTEGHALTVKDSIDFGGTMELGSTRNANGNELSSAYVTIKGNNGAVIQTDGELTMGAKAEVKTAFIAGAKGKGTRLAGAHIDLAEAVTLELSDVIIGDTSKLTDAPAYVNVDHVTVEATVGVNATALSKLAAEKTLVPTTGEDAPLTLTADSSVYAIQLENVSNVQFTGSYLTIALSGVDITTLQKHDWVSIELAGGASFGETQNVVVTFDSFSATGYYEQGGVHAVLYVESEAVTTPEPATATLSLLALAALAARRKRR